MSTYESITESITVEINTHRATYDNDNDMLLVLPNPSIGSVERNLIMKIDYWHTHQIVYAHE